jgi:hypothetical protein
MAPLDPLIEPRIPTKRQESHMMSIPVQKMSLLPNFSTKLVTTRMTASWTPVKIDDAWNGSLSPAIWKK